MGVAATASINPVDALQYSFSVPKDMGVAATGCDRLAAAQAFRVSVSRRTWALPPHKLNSPNLNNIYVSVSRRTWALPPLRYPRSKSAVIGEFQCPEGHGRCRHLAVNTKNLDVNKFQCPEGHGRCRHSR